MGNIDFDTYIENERRRECEEHGIEYSPVVYVGNAYELLKASYEKRVSMAFNFMADSKKLGRAIKVARVQAGKKQKDVAEQASVSKNYLCLIENGHRDPRLFTLCDICNAIGVKVWEVIRLAEEGAIDDG